MKVSKERQQLLKKIDELKEKSVNYFDVKNEFFLIDSNNLDTIHSHLYGYSVQKNGIYDKSNLTEDAVAGLNGRGCYIHVNVKDGKITVQQDFNGCYGIYLFKSNERGDYFALSNSFFRLFDHIKKNYSLSLNNNYINHFLTLELAAFSCFETPINEIELLERNAILTLDIQSKSLQIDSINYNDFSYSLDSMEGIRILDNWFCTWTNIFRNLQNHTNRITVDLSGGYDSRLSFMTVLQSGIDMKKIRVNSINDNLHCHAEDYRIASSIASYYKFSLNNSISPSQRLAYSITDILNIEYYTNMCFHKEPYFVYGKPVDKIYVISGAAGESIRSFHNESFGDMIKSMTNLAKNKYSKETGEDISISIRNILNNNYKYVCNKYIIQDENIAIYPYMHRDTRSRNHFGKSMVTNFLGNRIYFTPLLDPDLRKIQLNVSECPDQDLLMAMIYVRYCQKLIEFPFEGNRSISPETVEFAQSLNNRFPRDKSQQLDDQQNDSFQVEVQDIQIEQIINGNTNNEPVDAKTVKSYLKVAFDSSSVKYLFTTYFPEEIYRYARFYYKTHDYYPIRHCYSILGITRILQDIMVNNYMNTPILADSDRFIQEGAYEIPDVDQEEIIQRVKPFLTARINIKLMGQNTPDLQLLSLSDNWASATKPEWWQTGGSGYIITSYNGELEICVQPSADGEFLVSLMGLDIRDPDNNSKRIPYWIDYTSLSINGTKIFDDIHPAWHDKPYRYTFNVNSGEEIRLRITWLPHRSDIYYSDNKVVEKIRRLAHILACICIPLGV